MYAKSEKRPERWTRENLAWMAGLFEGEGYSQGRPRSYQRADGRTFTTVGFRLVISMSDEDVITKLHDMAGVGRLNGPRLSPSMKRRNSKPMWDFTANGAEGYAIAVAIWPWLGSRRRAQLHTAISAWRKSPGHWSRKTLSD